MKNLLLLFATTSAIAQTAGFVVPNYTLSQHQAPGCRVDSTIIEPNGQLDERILYAYDAGGRLVNRDRKQFSQNLREVNTWKYDVNDSIIENTTASGLGAPTSTIMLRYTRNAAKNIATDTILYNTGPQFTVNTAAAYVYDGSGNLAEVTRRSYNGTWTNMNRFQYTRNGSGQLLSMLFQGWNNGWQNGSLTTFTYNGSGLVTDVISQNWNTSSSAWVNGNRTQYVYTGNHLDTLVRSNGSTGSWKNVYRFAYSPAGATDSVTYEFWNVSQWEGYERYIRSWSQGRMTAVEIEELHSGNYEKVWKHEYVIDGQGNHVATDLSVYSGSSWVLLIPTVHHVTCHSLVGVAEQSGTMLKAFPVPSKGEVSFRSAVPVTRGWLQNIQGITVMQFDGGKADLSALPAGIYIARLSLADGSSAVVRVVRGG